MDKVIKDLYNELEVDNHLTEPEYNKYVKDSYLVLVENAKQGKQEASPRPHSRKALLKRRLRAG